MGVYVAGGELILYVGIVNALPDIPQLKPLLPNKLMAGIQVAPGGDRHVFRAAAAAGYALVYAGAAGQVYHVMVEGEGPSLPVTLKHQLRQLFILVHDYGHVLLGKAGGVSLGAHHRLHAQLIEPKVQHLLNILQKVGICVGKCAPHVVLFAAPGFHELLKLGHYIVPAAIARIVHAKSIVYLLAAVQAQHHVAALFIGKVDNIVIHKYAVGGEGKAEVFAPLLFHAPCVCHKVLYHLKVHQGLAAEKVHLKVAPAAGVFHKEVQRALAHLKAHHGSVPVILALAGKAV